MVYVTHLLKYCLPLNLYLAVVQLLPLLYLSDSVAVDDAGDVPIAGDV